MIAGVLSKHLAVAKANPEQPWAKHFVELAALYVRHQDAATYGLLMSAAQQVAQQPEYKAHP